MPRGSLPPHLGPSDRLTPHDGPAVDFLASEAHFVDHMLPVWLALPPRYRGRWLTGAKPLAPYMAALGLEPVMATSRVPDAPVLVASIGDMNRARRLRRKRVAYMEHGTGQSYAGDKRTATHPSYAGGTGRDSAAFIMAPNAMAAERWQRAYPAIPVHVIGACRVLPAPESAEPVLAISFHWSGGMPEMRNAFMHYRKVLPLLAQQFTVIGHGHPRIFNSLKTQYRRAGIVPVPDLQEVARRATVYAVDNSSTLYELGRTRPVIALNAPHYRRFVEHGLRFWSHVPVQVDDGATLLTVADRLLTMPESGPERAHREELMAEVFPHLDGAERASRLLVTWLTGNE